MMRFADQLCRSTCALVMVVPSAWASAQDVGTGQAPGTALVSAPPGVTFGRVTVTGSGCSVADTVPLVRADGKTVTLYFEKFEAEMSERDLMKYADCWIGYDIDVPVGYTYAVTQFYYNLLGEVRDGVHASLDVSYGFEGEGMPAASVEELPPNGSDEPIRAHGVKHIITSTEWAPCSVARKLQARVAITLLNSRPKTFSKLTLIQVDGRVGRDGDGGAVELQLAWAKCPAQR